MIVKKSVVRWGLAAVTVLLYLASPGEAATIFQDDFENGLNNWTGKDGSVNGHSGALVADPLSSGRGQVLTFTQTTYAGDVFSTGSVDVQAGVEYVLSFDYLGIAPASGDVGFGLGGMAGVAESSSPVSDGGDHKWLIGSYPNYGSQIASYGYTPYVQLVDDGNWRRYDVSFTWSRSTSLRVMLEDFFNRNNGLPVANDVYFDNVQLGSHPVPEPTSLVLWTGQGVMGLIATRRRRKVASQTSL